MMPTRRKSSGAYGWGNRTGPCGVAVRDWRDGQGGVWLEVRASKCSELQTLNVGSRTSRTRAVAPADFFSTLRGHHPLPDWAGGRIKTTHIIEPMPTHSVAVKLQEQHIGNHDVAHTSAVTPAKTLPPGRRCEGRMDYRCLCSYGVLEVVERGRPLSSKERPFT